MALIAAGMHAIGYVGVCRWLERDVTGPLAVNLTFNYVCHSGWCIQRLGELIDGVVD